MEKIPAGYRFTFYSFDSSTEPLYSSFKYKEGLSKKQGQFYYDLCHIIQHEWAQLSNPQFLLEPKKIWEDLHNLFKNSDIFTVI